MRVKNLQYTHGMMVLGLVLLDQLLKYVLSVYLGTLTIILNLISFSLLQENKYMGWLRIDSFLFPVITYSFILAMFYWNRKFFYQRPYTLVFLLAGITSNFLDRVVLGYVRDYIDVGGVVSFNLADWMIIGGTIGLVVKFKTCFPK